MNISNMISQLIDNGQISIVLSAHRQSLMQRELDSLYRLCQREASYLNRYDRLFRYVSLWLLQHGYAMTGISPHQTLLQISQQWADSTQVRAMIKRRHQLKKRICQQAPTPLEQHTLNFLLSCMQHQCENRASTSF